MMHFRLLAIVTVVAALLAPRAILAAGDVEKGRLKANTCMLCHGSKDFGGVFFQLQLAGRNADKLATKTNKYRTGKLFHPLMAIWVLGLTEQDAEDIAAYYESLEKPAVWVPNIKGDEEPPQQANK